MLCTFAKPCLEIFPNTERDKALQTKSLVRQLKGHPVMYCNNRQQASESNTAFQSVLPKSRDLPVRDFIRMEVSLLNGCVFSRALLLLTPFCDLFAFF